MKKLLLYAIIIIVAVIVFKDCFGTDSSMQISGYKGTVSRVTNNVIELTSGLKIKLLGVSDSRTDTEMFIRNSYIGKDVTLYPDSKLEQSFPANDATVRAYVILDENRLCLNHLVVNEYPDAYTELEMTDSTGWVIKGKPNVKRDLALYMKQRTFLIATDKSVGTGFFINEDGLAITNWHVMSPEQEGSSVAFLYQDSSDDSKIYTTKKRKIKNVLWSQDIEGLDITIFSVELENNEKVPYFALAERRAAVGSNCATFGNPLGYTASYSAGHISAYRPDENRPNIMLMQYEMSTNGGNSGGPVCDDYGQIIAVHELGRKDAQGINFGIDILQIRTVFDQLELKYGGG